MNQKSTDITGVGVRKYLDTHGYGFQYAVLRCADTLLNEGRSHWHFVVSEFPVGSAENPIHIDFILRSRSRRLFLVAECKRADPARSNWCFAKAPYIRRGADTSELVFENVQRSLARVESKPYLKPGAGDVYHLAFALRGPSKGEGISGGNNALKDATAQVLRGVNGLVDQIRPTVQIDSALLLPVIFTTAKLWVSDGDLSDADPKTGILPADWGKITDVPSLWYNYNQSPALRHNLANLSESRSFDFSEVFHAEYTRTIIVVGYDGIETFFKKNLEDWLID